MCNSKQIQKSLANNARLHDTTANDLDMVRVLNEYKLPKQLQFRTALIDIKMSYRFDKSQNEGLVSN